MTPEEVDDSTPPKSLTIPGSTQMSCTQKAQNYENRVYFSGFHLEKIFKGGGHSVLSIKGEGGSTKE